MGTPVLLAFIASGGWLSGAGSVSPCMMQSCGVVVFFGWSVFAFLLGQGMAARFVVASGLEGGGVVARWVGFRSFSVCAAACMLFGGGYRQYQGQGSGVCTQGGGD